MNIPQIRILGLPGIPLVEPGDNVVDLIVRALTNVPITLANGDILVVTQKIVSKAEGCLIHLADVTPSAFATRFAARWDKDPRAVEVVLQQSRRIVKMDRGVIIAETHHGFVCANAGVDQSNMDSEGVVAVLPPDPDASARGIRLGLHAVLDVDVPVIISDTFGRPWREGLVNVAIGLSGMQAAHDYTGMHDPQGYELRVTSLSVADELAAAAELVMNKLDQVPVAIITGYAYPPGDGGVDQLVRDPEFDLFR